MGLGCLGWAGVELTQTRFRSTPVLKCGGKWTQLNTGVELTGLSPVSKSQHQKQDNTNRKLSSTPVLNSPRSTLFNECWPQGGKLSSTSVLNLPGSSLKNELAPEKKLVPMKRVRFNTGVELNLGKGLKLNTGVELPGFNSEKKVRTRNKKLAPLKKS